MKRLDEKFNNPSIKIGEQDRSSPRAGLDYRLKINGRLNIERFESRVSKKRGRNGGR